MSDPKKEVMNALNRIVEWSRERGVPPGEWAVPLQDLLKGEDMFSMGVKQFLFPLAVFDRHGVIEIANDKMLEGTGLTDEDVKAGRASIKRVDDFYFLEAMALAVRGETHVVNGLKDPLESIGANGSYDTPDYPCALFFSLIRDDEPTRGVVTFFPFEYRPVNPGVVLGERAGAV